MTKGSNLVIVESPSKAKTIGKYLGPDYRVEACMGHLRDLPKSKMGVDLEHDFEPDYQPLASKAAIISELRSASKAAKHIYLATDPDREGEGDLVASEGAAGAAGRQDGARDVQRDHEKRRNAQHSGAARHRL